MDLQKQLKGLDQCLSRRREKLYRQILTNASKGLAFSQDVMWERGPDNIQYSKADFGWIFRASGLLAPITRSKSKKHGGTKALSHHTGLRGYVTAPLPVLPPLQIVRHPSLTINETFFTVSGHQNGRLDSMSSYQLPTILEEKEQHRTNHGDEFVKKNIVKQIPKDYRYKARLQSLDHYGSASTTYLGKDKSKDTKDFCVFYSVPKSSIKPRGLQGRVPETPLPVYYRIQGYCVSPACMDEEDGIHRMRNDVSINLMEPKKLPCLQDSLKSRAGKYAYNTAHNFELELYTAEMGRLDKGVQRWMGFPTKADDTTELGLRPPDYNRLNTEVPKQAIHYRPMPGLSSLRYAVEGWRNSWKIKTSWHSVTINGLKKDLTDLHCQVRLAAIATCASAAVDRPEVGPDPDETDCGQSYEVEAVPPELQLLILFALNDPVQRVQLAAAVCQYAIGTPNANARNILQKAVQHDSSGTGADGWVAAQCLALEGEANQTVIERLLSQLFLSNVPSDQEQAAALLASISSKSILVQSLVGERLNCCEWRNRVLACKTISQLKSPINKVLTNKLLYLMWNDWSCLVRQAAAQALGKLGLGSTIHNELSVKLHEGPTAWRVEALLLIGHLKIMTAKLLPSFLHCLSDEFAVVRNQACSAAAALMIKDELIQNKLFHLLQNESSCDVKVAAINALGRIGWLTPKLQSALLWALQHEEEPSVRIATCDALKMLGVKGPELQNLLQKRYALEPSAQVHRHMEDLMKHCGYSLEMDKGMGQMIAEQVKKLCTKSNITEKLLLLEDLKQQTQQKTCKKRKLARSSIPVTTSERSIQTL